MGIHELLKQIEEVYREAFGQTPLPERLKDISREALELSRYTSVKNLREEAGDLLSSLLMLLNESGWDVETLVGENLAKIQSRKAQYAALGRKKKVALYGGAFNPITTGHLKVAQFVLDHSQSFDEVWFMPCYAHMYGKDMATPQQRVDMLRAAIEASGDGRLKVFDYEIEHKLAGETFHMVKRLIQEDFAKQQISFSIIMGMDNANTFSQWVNSEELERLISFVVVPRAGVETDSTVSWYRKPPHIDLTSCGRIPSDVVSSTMVRDAIQQNNQEFLAEAVCPEALYYIEKHALYQKEPVDGLGG